MSIDKSHIGQSGQVIDIYFYTISLRLIPWYIMV